nr:EOG090X00BV [Moina brachiata]
MLRSKATSSVHIYPKSVSFGFHTAEDIRKISVVEVTNPDTFNSLGHPTNGGLYDPRMGPHEEQAGQCATCNLLMQQCPGHFGHINLPLPCFHPLFLRNLIAIIKLTCPACKCFNISTKAKLLLAGQLDLLHNGLMTEALQLLEVLQIKEDQEEEDDEVVARMKKAAGVESEGDIPPTRNVETLRQMYVKSFIGKVAAASLCRKCKGGWKKLQQYKSQVVYILKPGTALKSVGGHTLDMQEDEVPVEEADETIGGVQEVKSKTKKPTVRSVKKAGNMPVMYLTPDDARDHLREVWKYDKEVFCQLYPVLSKTNTEHPTDVFFLEVVPVIPNKFRPVNFSNGQVKENGQTMVLRKIVSDTYVVKTVLYAFQKDSVENLPADSQRMVKSLNGSNMLEKLKSAWLELQQDIDMIVDTSTSKEASSLVGFRQIMEKKEGLFRMHMMGKRVNYAARSVITPDPNLDVEEVGIPEVFAKKLTFPTPVTSWNVYDMRELVRNGPENHPGAVAIEDTSGKMIFLSAKDPTQREAVAKTLLTPTEAPKIVHRHLQSGDVLLLNRQPTLHRPSIMAHKARVLKGEKTLRLHYANCKAYNADFDGDEMNAHFPQNQVARSEAYNIVAVPHQYLVPKDGTPLSGLIQDHMISGVKLTIRGQFFNRSDYQQLVFAGLGGKPYNGATKLLPPAIWKPVHLWSGKQIISTIVLNLTPKGKSLINMDSTAKISVKDWQTLPARPWLAGGTPQTSQNAMTESEVLFRQGELICGVLDKTHYGATSYGLVHSFSELYGGTCACRLLSSFSRLFTSYLQLRGFTLGVKDILVTRKADKKRSKIVKKLKTIGDGTAARAVGLKPEEFEEGGVDLLRLKLEEAHQSRNPLKRMTIDREYKTETDKITNEINRTCIPEGLLRRFPDNNLALMIQSGAKGSSVNAMQISCLLGQIELEGKRPPLMISGRSLPSFVAYDTSPRAGGFISGRFMTGIRPQEFFFHCMAGREGLIDTAVKTSRSGYLQRCLVKHLEGVSVAYDQTVRDSDGVVVQFLYGEDGLDIGKSQYLNDKGIPFLVANKDCVRLTEPDMLDRDEDGEVKAAQKAVSKWLKKHGTLTRKERRSAFLNFSVRYQEEVEKNYVANDKSRPGRNSLIDEIEEAWRALSPDDRNLYAKKKLSPPEPVNARFSQARHIDVMDEQLDAMISRYLDRANVTIGRRELRRLVYSKSIAAACEPGEPVGVLAAQSIGEPSTQMTLNTFHFAGRGEMNVTLGIPRLREILTVASGNIATPSMDIPLLLKGEEGLRQAEKLRLKLTRVTLAEVLESVEVTERLSIRDSRTRIYGFTFKFLPHSSYKSTLGVKPAQVLHYFERKFVVETLLPGMRKEAAVQALQSLFVSKSASGVRKAATKADADEEDGAGEKVGAASVPPEKVGGDVDDDESDVDDADDADDADATAANRRAKHADEHEYEEEGDDEKRATAAPEDEGFEDEHQELDEERQESVKEKKRVEKKSADDEEDGQDEEEDAAEQEDSMTEEMELAIEKRKVRLMSMDPWIIDYEFDTNKSLWARLTLSVPLTVAKVDMSAALKRWSETAVVHQIPNIKRAFVIAPKTPDDDVVIKTDGVNIEAVFPYAKTLDLNRLYCNDVHAVARQYGIEAASRVIVKEVRNVFNVYGITVDPRHLTLVASFMTSGGGYRAFSRVGMADCTSPLQQMSYETATEFLKNATLQGKTDFLKTPSSRLVLGLPGLEGTGSFGLLQKLY